jgi:hypothetical protein
MKERHGRSGGDDPAHRFASTERCARWKRRV